jgi:hypothetical protein
MRTLVLPLFVASIVLAGVLGSTARADEPSESSPSSPPAYVAPPAAAEEDQTLLGRGAHHGGYGAPEVKLTTLTGDAALLVGGQGGWIINKRLLVGAAGYGLTTSHTPLPELTRPYGSSQIMFGYGGPRLGLVFASQRVLHATIGVLVGAGGVGVMSHDVAQDKYRTHNGAAFFALEPQVELEINVHHNFRLALSGAYRYIGNTDQPGLRSSDLSGPSAGLALKFGVF